MKVNELFEDARDEEERDFQLKLLLKLLHKNDIYSFKHNATRGFSTLHRPAVRDGSEPVLGNEIRYIMTGDNLHDEHGRPWALLWFSNGMRSAIDRFKTATELVAYLKKELPSDYLK